MEKQEAEELLKKPTDEISDPEMMKIYGMTLVRLSRDFDQLLTAMRLVDGIMVIYEKKSRDLEEKFAVLEAKVENLNTRLLSYEQ